MVAYVNGDKVDLGVAVLAGFRGGHFDDLARAAWMERLRPAEHRSKVENDRTFDDDVPVLAKGRALHGERRGGPSAGLERFSRKKKLVKARPWHA